MTALRIGLAVLLLVVVLTAVAIGLPLEAWLESGAGLAERHPAVAVATFVAAYVVAAVLVLPGTILTLAAGYLFGLPLGVALTSAASVLGATAAFLVGRFVARDWVVQRISHLPRFQALDLATHRDGFLIVLLARLSPLMPYSFLNYGLGVTAARFRDYVLATWLGMLPATVLYVYVGTLAKGIATLGGGGAPSWAAQSLLAAGFVATVALTLVITRRATLLLRARLAAEAQSARAE